MVNQNFIVKIPAEVPLEKAGPIMCAGITLYDPLRHYGATEYKDMCIGIVGIGGLGTMGIKISKALGHKVIAISSNGNKEAMAKEKGADSFVVSSDPKSMSTQYNSCDLILNTIPSAHELKLYLPLLKTNGNLVQLGLVPEPHLVSELDLGCRKRVSGSFVGGIEST